MSLDVFFPDRQFAERQDRVDPLAQFRAAFHLPSERGKELIYLCGNSLGLQPKNLGEAFETELKDWAEMGVEGHFDATNPWYSYHERFGELLGEVVGAHADEVVAMNSLTVNLHLLMASFYRPTKERFRIVMERGAFPSDCYAVASQVSHHGFDPAEAVVEIGPRPGEDVLRMADIEKKLDELGSSVALVLFGGVNFYSGQFYDLEAITRFGHKIGAYVGFDLAHAAGNVPLKLHDWDCDFAVWCSYKYLNSGPGSVGGAFVHRRHGQDKDLPRLAGWWGADPRTRFELNDTFIPQKGAAGWQLSNAPVFGMVPHYVSLTIFHMAGMNVLRDKAVKLTDYLFTLLETIQSNKFYVLTPRDPTWRGCQLSLRFGNRAKKLNRDLRKVDIITDYRAPDVIRVAPVPLYTRFVDVWDFVDLLKKLMYQEYLT